jgi:hypothetical protein
MKKVAVDITRVHGGANPGKYGVSPTKWTSLLVGIASLSNHLAIFQICTTLIIYMDIRTNIRTTSVTSSTFGIDQGK